MAGKTFMVYGSDGYRVKEKSGEIVNKLLSRDEQVTSLEVIEGAVDTKEAALAVIHRCIAGLRSASLFCPKRVVWLKSASFLRESRAGSTDDVKAQLEVLGDLLKQGLPDDTNFLITADGIDGRTKFFKSCSSAGEKHEFNVPEDKKGSFDEAADFLRDRLQAAGYTMSYEVMDLFLRKVGLESWHIIQEADKLMALADGRKEIGRKDVEDVTSDFSESKGWDLPDAVTTGNLAQSIAILRKLLFQKEDPIFLVILLEQRFRELLVLRTALDKGWLRSSGRECSWAAASDEADQFLNSGFLKKDLRKQHPYRVMLLARQAERQTMASIARWLEALANTHEKIVTSSVASGTHMEMLLVRMLSAKPAG
jgi:DNA polymerase III subunit delta